jgi:hypothetical protein
MYTISRKPLKLIEFQHFTLVQTVHVELWILGKSARDAHGSQ